MTASDLQKAVLALDRATMTSELVKATQPFVAFGILKQLQR